jgi:hypothetical protein
MRLMSATRIRATTTAVLVPIYLLIGGLAVGALSDDMPQHLPGPAICLGQALGGLLIGAACAAIGPGLRSIRWLVGVVVAALYCLALLVSLRRTGMPLHFLGTLILSLPLAFFASLAPFAILRFGRDWRISLAPSARPSATRTGKFGLAALLIATTGVAICLVLSQIGYRCLEEIEFTRPVPLGRYVPFLVGQVMAAVVISIYGACVGLPSLWALLARRVSVWRIALAVICMATATLPLWLTLSWLLQLLFGNYAPRAYETLHYLILPLQAGLATTILGLTIAARSAGFRLASVATSARRVHEINREVTSG